MVRGNKTNADALHARVLEVARANPKMPQREIAAHVGISRSMVCWYLNRAHRLELRRGVAQPLRPGRRRMRRTAYHVTMRAVAVRAVHAAFPQFTVAEIADALGMNRQVVRGYLLGTVKTELHELPSWAHTLFAACAVLASDRPGAAIPHFGALCRELSAWVQNDAA